MTERCAREGERWSLQVYEEHLHVFFCACVPVGMCVCVCVCVCATWVYCKITQGVRLSSLHICPFLHLRLWVLVQRRRGRRKGQNITWKQCKPHFEPDNRQREQHGHFTTKRKKRENGGRERERERERESAWERDYVKNGSQRLFVGP